MASGFAQHYMECTTCDGNAEYHCNTCQFDLCQTCKETHQRKKKTENHKVVLYKDRNEKVDEMCCTHSDKTYDACCKECELPLCMKCIKESHARHTIVEIEDIFNEKLKEFNKYVQELKEKIIPQCEDVQKNLSKEMENCRNSLTQVRSDLLATAQSIKDLVELVLKEKTERLNKIEDIIMQELQCHETKLKNYTNSLNSVIREFEVLRRTDKKAQFLIKHKEKLQINHLQSLADMYHTPAPSFKPCPVSKEQIKRLFGDIIEKPRIPFPKTTVLHRLRICPNFEIANTFEEICQTGVTGVIIENIHHFVFQDENKFWVNNGSGCLSLYDMRRQILHKIKTASCGDGIHTVTEQGILYIAANNHNIYFSDMEGKETELITVEGWKPISVYKSRLNGDIFVGMLNESTAQVIRYCEKGRVLQHIQYTNQQMGRSPHPHFITENSNGDVIVANNSPCNRGVVIVVENTGRHRFSYTGNPEYSMGYPWGVVTDILKNILICDCDKKKIHIINEDGMFLAYVELYKWGYPSCIDIDLKHNIWVGFHNPGTIQKFRYLQEYA